MAEDRAEDWGVGGYVDDDGGGISGDGDACGDECGDGDACGGLI